MYGDSPYPLLKPDGWDGDKELDEFKIRHHPGTIDPILDAILGWIDEPEAEGEGGGEGGGFGGVEYLGGIGYCYGGRYIIRLLAEGRLEVGVVNHPSFFTIEEVKGLEKVKPVHVAGGGCCERGVESIGDIRC